MVRKLFKNDDSLAISLPVASLELLGLGEGSELHVEVDIEGQRILLSPTGAAVPDIDPAFARQLDEFIEQYRPALEALAR